MSEDMPALDLAHVPLRYPDVYPPTMPDTIFFQETLSAVEELSPTAVILEVACGAAPLAALLAKRQPRAYVLASDVSASACSCAAETAARNGICSQQVCRLDLTLGLRPGLIDLLVCHPPYVPTSADVLNAATCEAAAGKMCKNVEAAAWTWAGGPGGTGLLDRLLSALPTILAPKGSALVLWFEPSLAESFPRLEALGLRCSLVSERRLRSERFCVLRVERDGEP